MAHVPHPSYSGSRARAQRGLTLIELMVSVVIGMLMLAALAALIADQSGNRAEVDRSGKMIENARYAVQVVANDALMAGYWGESTPSTSTTTLPSACSVDLDVLRKASVGLPVQGYNSVTAADLPCIPALTLKAGADALVVRHVVPDATANADLKAHRAYLQTGLDGAVLDWKLDRPLTDGDGTAFTLKKKDGSTAPIRQFLTHIYFLSNCSKCDAPADQIPTLKRAELLTSTFVISTIAEGVEDFQVEYGVDNAPAAAPDGSPDEYQLAGGASLTTLDDWKNVMTVKVFLMARTTEKSAGFTDNKSYVMGSVGAASAPASAPVADRSYRRHVMSQTIRLVNPSGRRAL